MSQPRSRRILVEERERKREFFFSLNQPFSDLLYILYFPATDGKMYQERQLSGRKTAHCRKHSSGLCYLLSTLPPRSIGRLLRRLFYSPSPFDKFQSRERGCEIAKHFSRDPETTEAPSLPLSVLG